ncbi:MAG: tRNA 2-thiouridine(34) synthase MnmA [Desulfobacteraceae bacterium]|nr:tRNA 2-thiouridine(34) synthase MnmA [Desulfobacteraceae bacterium]
MKSNKTAIALSGGIDSLVAAALLKKQGDHIIALHFLTGYEAGYNLENTTGPPPFEELAGVAYNKLQPLANMLGAQLHIIDLRAEFKRIVVDYFITTYARGKTPNPCIICNPLIKFDILFNWARSKGASRIATGHYARIRKDQAGYHLLRGKDSLKDQSYFLARLTNEQLGNISLPLGGMTKEQTRELATQMQLKPVIAQESQDICFIQGRDYSTFLQNQPDFEFRPGPIEDNSGRVIGRHQGLHRFTIGQRRGINCPAAQPYYVIRLETQRNCLVVGAKQDLLRKTCRICDINWIIAPADAPIFVLVKVRYRHRAVPAKVFPLDNRLADVEFNQPQEAVTPGQAAVFYQNDEVLGGGWIE